MRDLVSIDEFLDVEHRRRYVALLKGRVGLTRRRAECFVKLWAYLLLKQHSELGIVNALVQPIFGALDFLTFGLTPSLTAFIISVICFGIAAYLVKGFRLVNGILSAILGALALSVVSNLVYYLIDYISAMFA